MKQLAVCLVFVVAQFLTGQELSLNATNTVWTTLEDHSSYNLPEDPNWQKMTIDTPFITSTFSLESKVTLQNFKVASEPVPRMLSAAVYAPAGGIVSFGEKEVSRYIEFIEEVAYVSDNTVEYLLDLEGRWSLKDEYKSDEWLIEFMTGHENWLEILHGDKILGESKSQVILKGSDIPKTGQMQIRSTSWKKNNKGLLKVRVFKVYEKVKIDRFKRGFTALKDSKSSWLVPTTKDLKASKMPPETTPALYKRTYICSSEDSTKNVLLSVTDSVQNILINGKSIDPDLAVIPDGVLTKGENEVIYYSNQVNGTVHQNFELTSSQPFFIRTTVNATENSVVKPVLRGAQARVYINGVFAGKALPEKAQEALGFGLFQNGDNEIVLVVMQNTEKTFVESLNIATVTEKSPLVLPWFNADKSIADQGPGLYESYEGTLLTQQTKAKKFSTSFKLVGDVSSDLQLVFNDGNRLPEWTFDTKLSAPYSILLNGTKVYRQGHTFTLPASLLKKNNTISFDSEGLRVPAPLLYTSVVSSESKAPSFKLISKEGSERLIDSGYFSGDELNYRLTFDQSTVDKIEVTLNGKPREIASDELTSEPIITLGLKEPGEHGLVVKLYKNDKLLKSFEETLTTLKFPANPRGWLRANGQQRVIEISDKAFFGSESNIFPEQHFSEWLRRELISDSDSFQFGAIRDYQKPSGISLYATLPNGELVFDKFYGRLNSQLKIESRGLPTRFILKNTIDKSELWKSAAFVLQYLKWLEAGGMTIDWSLPTTELFKAQYKDQFPDKAKEFLSSRVSTITSLVKQMALTGAPGSTFEEEIE
ncbi:MAG: hypothetical protein NE334_19045 [Lentisphaeraceae bacterium]|nr:hypothetical protein [Lentisphaeraceae bacterium]